MPKLIAEIFFSIDMQLICNINYALKDIYIGCIVLDAASK